MKVCYQLSRCIVGRKLKQSAYKGDYASVLPAGKAIIVVVCHMQAGMPVIVKRAESFPYLFTSIPYSSAASRRLTFSFMISKIRMIPPFLRKIGGLPDMGQAAVCVFSYAVFVSFSGKAGSFFASRKAFFRAPCLLICA